MEHPPAQTKPPVYVALWDFDATDAKEVSLKKGWKVHIQNTDESGWCKAKIIESNQIGWVPFHFLAPLADSNLQEEKRVSDEAQKLAEEEERRRLEEKKRRQQELQKLQEELSQLRNALSNVLNKKESLLEELRKLSTEQVHIEGKVSEKKFLINRLKQELQQMESSYVSPLPVSPSPASSPAALKSHRPQQHLNNIQDKDIVTVNVAHKSNAVKQKMKKWYENAATTFKKEIPHHFELIPFEMVSSLLQSILNRKLSPSRNSQILSYLSGPKDSGVEESYYDYVYCKTVSTYPWPPNQPVREGDPICDRFVYQLHPNRGFIALADGCKLYKL